MNICLLQNKEVDNETDEVVENSLYILELIIDFTFSHPSENCNERRIAQIDMLQMISSVQYFYKIIDLQ